MSRTWRAILSIGILAVAALLIARGYLTLLGLALSAAYLLVLTTRWPMLMLFLGLLLAADFDYTLGLQAPVLLQLPGFQLNGKDAVFMLVFVVGVDRLMRRGERPVFMGALILVFLAVAVSWLIGTIAGTTDVPSGLNGLRNLEPYLMYFGACGIVDSRSRLQALAGFTYFSIIVAVPYQVWQAFSGVGAHLNTVSVGGVTVPYVGLGLAPYVLLGACMAWAALIVNRWQTRHVLFVALALVGVAIQISRQWYLYALIGLLIVLLLAKTPARPRNPFLLLALAFVVLLLVSVANTLLASQFGGSLFEVMAARGSDLIRPTSSTTFLGRVATNRQMWEIFTTAPVFGVGPGQTFDRYAFFFNDVGFLNTLVRYGAFGFIAVLGLIGSVLVEARQLLAMKHDRASHFYALGTLGALGALLLGYSFAADYIMLYPAGFVLALTILDRAHRLSAQPATLQGEIVLRDITPSNQYLLRSG